MVLLTVCGAIELADFLMVLLTKVFVLKVPSAY